VNLGQETIVSVLRWPAAKEVGHNMILSSSLEAMGAVDYLTTCSEFDAKPVSLARSVSATLPEVPHLLARPLKYRIRAAEEVHSQGCPKLYRRLPMR